MFSFLFIAILVVVSGAIALIGDRLGSNVGRKRRSLLGLRPRHTATLVTIVTGMLITMLTLGAILLLSEQARLALFGVEKLGKKLLYLNGQISQRNAQLVLLRGKLYKISTDYASKEKALKHQLGKATKELEHKNDELQKLERAISMLKRDYASTSVKLSSAENEVANLNTNKRSLLKEIDRLKTDVVDVRAFARRMAIVKERGQVVFRADQVLTLGAIPDYYNPTKCRAKLLALIDEADKTAVRMGARGARDAVSALREKRLAAGNGVYWSREQFELAVRLLAEAKRNSVVTVSSFTNTTPGEPVLLSFHIMENKLIFRRGEEIINARIDGNKTQEAIGEEVIKLLRRVRETALLKGVLPDPEEGTVGSVSAFCILDTIRNIKGYGKEVDFSVKAAFDTWTSGPLMIDFAVEHDI
ncbi:MAG: DUF3084 domain-containing protein [bacterium]|nr:DUF3084 domain-containing protein [bacterium]MDD3804917.1 DUF3084 domain-containing protein [bacterium]MDD4152760.1 DUF3084 domain-containing protein [bacterium]MDD4557415.1 DUF3084 domain-containing protein [bacterium]